MKAELDLILQSQGFRRSERHARFLRFVCEAALSGEAAHLNEYLIAHRVFDRGPDYSPGEDSVVRRQAFSLLHKLQDYYASEGKTDPVRIDLPVGRYVPSFKFVDEPVLAASSIPAVEAQREPFGEPIPMASGALRSPWGQVAIEAVFAVLCIAAGWLTGAWSQRATLNPVLSRIWGPWLSFSYGGVICFSNALTAGIRRTDEPFPENNLTRGIALSEEQAGRIREQFQLAAAGFFYMNPALAHAKAKMGEALGSIPLAAMFTKTGVPVRATQSRYLNWHDFRSQNLILLGHDEANQWLDPILSKLPFRLGRTTVDKPRRILITNPAGTKAGVLSGLFKGSKSSGRGLCAYLVAERDRWAPRPSPDQRREYGRNDDGARVFDRSGEFARFGSGASEGESAALRTLALPGNSA